MEEQRGVTRGVNHKKGIQSQEIGRGLFGHPPITRRPPWIFPELREAQDGHVVINGNLTYSGHEVFGFLKGVRKERTETELYKNRFHLIQKLEDGIPVSENCSE
ncbi:hypothetical protein DUI87_03810 [Hirundo rustica rustica]|uniref:Uncharacterized protein n=1 Tax=Hirundo rustica rustica TaxID=333673 RepID=A0A3M0L1C4_HIRRU|nr:hypothetical protein DUI87_03810 [Hirundo rustica rustica]